MQLRTLFVLVLTTFISCKNTVSEKKEVVIEQAKNQNQAKKIALDFINDYVVFCNNQDSEIGLLDWVLKQSNVSENFKTDLKKIIADAAKQDPEIGLDFDPIFDAQDYPDKGFEFEKSEKNSEFIIVKGKDWSDFTLRIKMMYKDETWFVNGVGVINMLATERVER